MAFEKLPAIDEEPLSMDICIAVGFGVAQVTKNGKVVYDENQVEEDKYWQVKDAEDLAKQDPDNDWRIILVAPLSEHYFQRQGESLWVLFKKGPGFA